MAAAPALVPIPGVCRVCGCSQFDACVNEEGWTCGWADPTHTLCTFCAELHADMHVALDEGLESPDDTEPRVVLATEGECAAYIRSLRGGN
jgi:hypothetical protein